jgi:hypothetical protein
MPRITHPDIIQMIDRAGRSSEQVFVITRAPEAKPLTARELKSLLYFNRTDTEWHVREDLYDT